MGNSDVMISSYVIDYLSFTVCRGKKVMIAGVAGVGMVSVGKDVKH